MASSWPFCWSVLLCYVLCSLLLNHMQTPPPPFFFSQTFLTCRSLAGSRALLIVGYAISTGLSIAICIAFSSNSTWSVVESLDSKNPYYVAMIGSTLFTVFIAMWSSIFNNSCFYDAWWSVGPMIFIVFWYAIGLANDKKIPTARVILVFISVFTWGIRSSYFVIRFRHWSCLFPAHEWMMWQNRCTIWMNEFICMCVYWIRLTHNWWIGWPGLEHEVLPTCPLCHSNKV